MTLEDSVASSRATSAGGMNIYVDLDGTLVKSDILFEGVIALLKKRFTFIFYFPFWILKGKPFFKHAVFSRLEYDFSTLPYTTELVEYLREEKRKGRKIVLATGNCTEVANSISRELPIFDGILATETQNLAGRLKLERIKQHANGQPFAYAGNSSADHPILEASEEPILVNPTASLKRKWKSRTAHRTIDGRTIGPIRSIVKSMRVHQWVKNALLFVPLFLSHQAGELAKLADVTVGFLAFSLIASGTYLLNDLLDITADRKHLVKRRRPFAAADLPILPGCWAIIGLVGVGALIAYAVSPKLLLMCGIYLVGTLTYSFFTKSFIILDAINLAGLYTVRLGAGAAIIDTALSFWLLGFSMFVFLSLAFIKRCTELAHRKDSQDVALHGRDYRAEDLSLIKSMGVASGFIAILVVAMYINHEDVTTMYREPRILWLICPVVLYWLMRMWIKMGRGEMYTDPVEFSIRDRTSLLCGLLIVLTILAAI